jgi:hypothetical protein
MVARYRELPDEYRPLRHDAPRLVDADEGEAGPILLFGYEGSIEAANRDAEAHAALHPLDAYDLVNEDEPPY